MERQLSVPVGKGKRVTGLLRGSLHQPVVVFVHGLFGDPNEHKWYNGARYLERHRLSSFRYNLYDSRNLVSATLATHAADLDRVVMYFRKHGVKKIFVIGQSYGGPVILVSKQKDFDAIVLWDASHNISAWWRRNTHYNQTLKKYVFLGQLQWLVGRRMFREAQNLPWKELARDVTAPIKVITAGNGLLKSSRRYYLNAKGPKAYTEIKGATHNFDEDGAAEQLFATTTQWLNKYR